MAAIELVKQVPAVSTVTSLIDSADGLGGEEDSLDVIAADVAVVGALDDIVVAMDVVVAPAELERTIAIRPVAMATHVANTPTNATMSLNLGCSTSPRLGGAGGG